MALEWEGEIPAVLEGTYFRCGPDRQFPPRCADSWPGANADGMVSAFMIGKDHINFRMRYVMTERLMAERVAGRALFGAYRNPFTDDPAVKGVDRTVANTAIVWHADTLFACKEDGLPYVIDPVTLATLGRYDFDGELGSATLTAHPKFDPETGEMLFYGGQVDGLTSSRMLFGVADAQGKLVRRVEFDAPYPGMVHDFAITPRFAIFLFVPVTTDQARVEAGGPFWIWEPRRASHIGVLPRDGTAADMRWFHGPAFWSWHTMNAFEEGHCIHLDTTVAPHNALFPDAAGVMADPASFKPTRITCDFGANSDAVTTRPLADLASDFYSCDPRYLGRPYRYGFMAASVPACPSAPGYNATVRLDHGTGQTRIWPGGDQCTVQEPIFVPRHEGAPEGDGFLFVVVSNFRAHRTELRILDTGSDDLAPVAAAWLPFLIPMALHGTFVPHALIDRAAFGREKPSV
jgi:carotenoid cleavage dioxygenase